MICNSALSLDCDSPAPPLVVFALFASPRGAHGESLPTTWFSSPAFLRVLIWGCFFLGACRVLHSVFQGEGGCLAGALSRAALRFPCGHPAAALLCFLRAEGLSPDSVFLGLHCTWWEPKQLCSSSKCSWSWSPSGRLLLRVPFLRLDFLSPSVSTCRFCWAFLSVVQALLALITMTERTPLQFL